MKAQIEPLDGKYYGTTIIVDHPNDYVHMTLWFMGDGYPSERELGGDTYEFWKDMGDGCDSHYESKDCYEFCKKLVEAINKM